MEVRFGFSVELCAKRWTPILRRHDEHKAIGAAIVLNANNIGLVYHGYVLYANLVDMSNIFLHDNQINYDA